MQEAAVEPGRRPAQQQQFPGVDLRRPKGYAPAPMQETAVKVAEGVEGDPCPRCASRDTKFCYYNNYNTSQPRHFCKGCRRYWTKGGTLRNVPVGGGTRKKPSSSSSYAAAANADNKPPKKKPASKKRRVVAPAPEPAAAAASAVTNPVAAADSAKTTTTTDGASEITTETAAAVPAAPVADEEDSLAHLLLQPGTGDAESVALGLGLSDFPSAAGKTLMLDDDSFEWPAAFDLGLGACWASGSAGFADPDPACLFLNLP